MPKQGKRPYYFFLEENVDQARAENPDAKYTEIVSTAAIALSVVIKFDTLVDLTVLWLLLSFHPVP